MLNQLSISRSFASWYVSKYWKYTLCLIPICCRYTICCSVNRFFTLLSVKQTTFWYLLLIVFWYQSINTGGKIREKKVEKFAIRSRGIAKIINFVSKTNLYQWLNLFSLSCSDSIATWLDTQKSQMVIIGKKNNDLLFSNFTEHIFQNSYIYQKRRYWTYKYKQRKYLQMLNNLSFL